jgi:hypothetical protein
MIRFDDEISAFRHVLEEFDYSLDGENFPILYAVPGFR